MGNNLEKIKLCIYIQIYTNINIIYLDSWKLN